MANISSPEPNLLVLEGEIDLARSPAVKEAFYRLLEKKPKNLYVDLSAVSYMDSSGLAALIEAMQKLHPHGGTLALFGTQPAVLNILQIARLDQVFRLFPDLASARAELEK